MELPVEEAIHVGIKAHKTGDLKRAEEIYAAILKTQPMHPDANHNMGILKIDFGEIDNSIMFFEKQLLLIPQ